MPHVLVSLFAHYGYLVIFVGVLLENAGIPAPGHTVVLAGAFLAQEGTLSIWWVGAIAAIAAILGDNAGYWIGRKGGRALIARHRRLLHFNEDREAWVRGFFERHGPKAVLIARFVSGLQTIAAIMAGVSHMRWLRFFIWNVIGAVVWAAAYSALGYLAGTSWEALHVWIGRAGLLALVMLLGIALVVVLHRRRARLVAWLQRRLPPGMSPRAATVLVLSLIAVGVFTGLAAELGQGELTGFDAWAAEGVQHLQSHAATIAMELTSAIAAAPVIAVVVIAVMAWCISRRDWLAAVVLPCTVAGGAGILHAMLAEAFARPRPGGLHVIELPASFSFPSGHAMTAVVAYGTIAAVISRELPRARWSPFVGAALLSLAIGFSRVYLGVHYATDVLGGFAAGNFCVLIADAFLEIPPGRATRPPAATPPPATGPAAPHTPDAGPA